MDGTVAEPGLGRSRSFGGCATCRKRHVKCDEQRPSCLTCQNSGAACGGYEKAIFFDFEGAREAGSLRFRRPLLTEQEQRSLSESLTLAVPWKTVNRSLSQIDEGCDDSNASTDVQISRGPFGVFRGRPVLSTPESLNSAAQVTDVNNDVQATPQDFNELTRVTGTSFLLRTRQWLDVMFEPALQDVSTFFLDAPDITLDGSRIEEINDDSLMADLDASAYHPDAESFHLPPHPSEEQVSAPTDCGPVSMFIPSSNTVPHNAALLLKHYQTTVLPLLTPFKHSKTPWHVLFVPHAKNCLAALILEESINSASLCSFYGILATSAFSTGGLSQSSVWLDQARRYKQYARESVKNVLKNAYNIPKTAKYKSILMALLTLVQVSMATGNRNRTDCYLLEAEKFIRLRGLNRKKSRKVRLLHHCYAFERILHESTVVGCLNSSHRLHVHEAVETSRLPIFQDNMSFRLGNWSDLDEDMKRVKCQEEGENDLHLEYPGLWSATLYPEIFGVPETWLFLISLVIRLAREKDMAQQGASDNLSAKDFLSRAKAIERCINEMRQPQNIDHCADPAVENILDAMRNALSIYFYRKIYDLDPALLQQKIERVRDCLLNRDLTTSDVVYGSARLLWPVLIAASEATKPEVQVSFALWLRNAAQSSGLRLFSGTLENLERIWEEKNMHFDVIEPAVQYMMNAM